MNGKEISAAIHDGRYDQQFSMLYGDVKAAKERYIKALERFEEIFPNCDRLHLFSAPGRTEVSGNHTDHQHGSVLAGSVHLDVIAVVAPTNDNRIYIQSEGYSMDTIELNRLARDPGETGRAAALIRGVCSRFAEMGCSLSGLCAYTTSNVLKGSGLSSSAAFEVLIGNILNGLYFDHQADAVTLAKIGQYAEREYFGKPCGLLDQIASSLGGFTYADFHDPENPITETIELDPQSYGYTLCVVDTGGDHANLTQDYADITSECQAISKSLGVEVLRDIDKTDYYRNLAVLRKEHGDRAVLRAFHFIHEQQRVEEQKAALKNGDFKKFLSLVNESGQSSYDYLQNLYSLSDPHEQGLCLAIALTKEFLQDDGACRVHGGGFAGTIQCYIPADRFPAYRKMIEGVFGEHSCCVLKIRPVGGYEILL